jgi:DNA-binding IclR family transcriptional regulator
LDNEENVMGARCIGAPILNARDEAVAALSLSAPITRISTEKIEMFAVAVKDAAAEIATRLGFNHPDKSRVLNERSPVDIVAG